jgi:hypothetical protein
MNTSMRDFVSWLQDSAQYRARPWVVLGKGPSFDRRADHDLTRFGLMSLNHVVREQAVDVAHAIDLDVIDACADALIRNARVLVMPWVPHVRNRPGTSTLEQLAGQHDVLRRLRQEGRLLWYNLSTASEHREGSPVIPVRFFSAEAALGLLAEAGVSTVRSLGVDGGNAYAAQFRDLADTTRLANGRSSFDRQFESIAAVILRTGVDFAPLDVESPVRVFVGTTQRQMLATRVLEYSIKKHASLTTVVTPLHQVPIPIATPAEQKNRPRTPFSFQRFVIPEAAGRRGHAIYVDSDMQVFRDIKELWQWPMRGAPLLSASEPTATVRRPQFSVMLLDCEALDWRMDEIVRALDAGVLTYERLVYQMEVAPGLRADIPDCWNSLERFDENETALLHYTDMVTQPWLTSTNPLAYLWCRALFEAVDHGFITLQQVRDDIRDGNVRPSLEAQLAERIEDPLLLPRHVRALDKAFVPPHASGAPNRQSAFIGSVTSRLLARVRNRYRRSAIVRLHRRLQDRLR